MNQDGIDVELRTPGEVRARMLILTAVLRRLALENATPGVTTELLEEAFDEREWLRDQGLANELTAREAELLNRPPGSLAPAAIVDASWQGEALLSLAWAVRVLEMPPIDTIGDPGPLMNLVPQPWDAVRDWMSDPAIVSESEAVRERERAEIWHWRTTAETLRRDGPPADRQDVEAAIRDVAAESLAAGILSELHEGDFPARGRAVKDLPGSDVDELIAITSQRLRALNWLCGFGDSWDEIPLDV